jgi:hypothetical protein
MNASNVALPPDLRSAIRDHLLRLEISSRAAIQWAQKKLVAPTSGSFQRAAAQVQLRIIAQRAMHTVTEYTRSTLETLIWLRGMKVTIEESDDDLGARSANCCRKSSRYKIPSRFCVEKSSSSKNPSRELPRHRPSARRGSLHFTGI